MSDKKDDKVTVKLVNETKESLSKLNWKSIGKVTAKVFFTGVGLIVCIAAGTRLGLKD